MISEVIYQLFVLFQTFSIHQTQTESIKSQPGIYKRTQDVQETTNDFHLSVWVSIETIIKNDILSANHLCCISAYHSLTRNCLTGTVYSKVGTCVYVGGKMGENKTYSQWNGAFKGPHTTQNNMNIKYNKVFCHIF